MYVHTRQYSQVILYTLLHNISCQHVLDLFTDKLLSIVIANWRSIERYGRVSHGSKIVIACS